MIKLRPSNERGVTNFDWLDSRHSFSFGQYVAPEYSGFRALRVINEDIVEPGKGFHPHGHHDMEIITYVLEGALEHKDSIGNGSIIKHGDVQRMSAGTGIAHSEFNHSNLEKVHLLQIWIIPDEKDLSPSYEQKYFTEEEKTGVLKLIGSSDGSNGSVTIHQDVNLYSSIIKKDQDITHNFTLNRFGWLQVVKGHLVMNGNILRSGDGAAISGEEKIIMIAKEDTEFLLFDLA